ncbi:hypothetical protein Dimus_004384 [Dionaea muscipula]
MMMMGVLQRNTEHVIGGPEERIEVQSLLDAMAATVDVAGDGVRGKVGIVNEIQSLKRDLEEYVSIDECPPYLDGMEMYVGRRCWYCKRIEELRSQIKVRQAELVVLEEAESSCGTSGDPEETIINQ